MFAARLQSPRHLLGFAALGLAAAFAILVGLAIGANDQALMVLVAAIVGVAGLFAGCLRPRLFFWVLLGTSVTLPFLPITPTRGANLVDLLLVPTLIGAWMSRPKATRGAPGSVVVAVEARNLKRATLAYYGVSLLSLLALALRGFPQYAGDSLLIVLRGVQGILFFPLVLYMVRDRRDLQSARTAIALAFLVSVAVNAFGIAVLGVVRAGAAWNVAVGDYFISSPNEAGFGVVFLWAIVLAIPFRRGPMIALLILSLLFLAATTSRSGVLSWFTFIVVWAIARRKGWLLLIPLAVLAMFPLLPEAWTGKFVRTLLLQRGSFEIYSSVIRIYAWHTAIRIFMHFPILGVGFLGFRFFSYQFNDLTLNLGTAENFLLETAAGMGILGVAAILWVANALFRLVRAVRASSVRGTSAARLAELSGPFLIAVVVANATGDNLIGIMGLTQLAVFSALLIAASRIDGGPTADPVPPAPRAS